MIPPAASPVSGPSQDAERTAELAATAVRLGELAHCLFLRREGSTLVEYPPTEDGLRLPVGESYSGDCLAAGRVLVADVHEEKLHTRERAVLRRHKAEYWLAVPVMTNADDEAVGLVVGLRKGALSPDTGVQERAVLALVAGQLALQWRVAELEQAVSAARIRGRELEGEAEGLLHSLRAAALVLTPDNRLDDANRPAELLLDFQLSAARGRLVREVVQSPEVRELLERTGVTGGGELPEITLGGQVLEVRIAPVFDRRGELLRRVVVLNDTTLVKQADELKTQFVSMISHELRTPLTSIKAFASTLLHGELGQVEDQREWLRIIDRECDRLTGLVNDLLTISRLESGQRLPMQFAEFDLVALLGDVLEAARALATRHTFDVQGPAKQMLEADSEKVKQVLTNLVNNAVRYSPRGGQVTLSVVEKGTDIEVRVVDQGVGIRAEHLNLIFDKFFQVDGSSTRRVGGTGLGLYLTRRLVEAHEGKIWAESEPGVGSTFVVTLPRRRHVRDRLGA